MTTPFIRIENLSFSIKSKTILDSIDFVAKKGEFISIIGENGAGKSTLLKCIMKINRNYTGKIEICGKLNTEMAQKNLAKLISFVPQTISESLPFTVREFMEMSRFPYLTPFSSLDKKDYDAIHHALEITETTEFIDRMIDTLSGGEKQRVLIAGAIAQETRFILLDEPASFLDPAKQIHILEILKETAQKLHKGIIIVSHDINSAALWSDKIAAMKKGKIKLFDKPENIMKNEVLSELFGRSFTFFNHPQTNMPLILPEAPK